MYHFISQLGRRLTVLKIYLYTFRTLPFFSSLMLSESIRPCITDGCHFFAERTFHLKVDTVRRLVFVLHVECVCKMQVED